MDNQTTPTTKKCKFCGKELPQEAIFCYYCHRELLTRPERPGQDTQTKSPKNIIILITALIVISFILLLLFK